MIAAGLVTAGCAHSTVYVKQKDGTVDKSTEVLWWPSASRDTTFSTDEDYVVATRLGGVTYEWPKGAVSLEGMNQIRFEGDAIRCQIDQRRLSVDGRSFGDFQKGDRVRITPDGRVFVNETERPPIPEA
jgi:hypothetical protein